ncbi:hypothetical protein LEP1GSC058_2771 [Leptospira fainei serovar Hurstbridge str. BUT 6]|uniref:Uncharacterized protein n=1 Tax=Leptospira fainei serovar Hurstbridge str. BUT 6 TaxID=1193011 RepID=S3UVZ1_9LEPT|nr:hypothetical protein LEP1GSC058_2771 [Leptospira fainei serovar Hurstbridge str. BUT 6]
MSPVCTGGESGSKRILKVIGQHISREFHGQYQVQEFLPPLLYITKI